MRAFVLFLLWLLLAAVNANAQTFYAVDSSEMVQSRLAMTIGSSTAVPIKAVIMTGDGAKFARIGLPIEIMLSPYKDSNLYQSFELDSVSAVLGDTLVISKRKLVNSQQLQWNNGTLVRVVNSNGVIIKQLQGRIANFVAYPDSTGHTLQFLRIKAGGGYEWASAGGASGVTSFNTRTGAVSPVNGDYAFSQLTGTAAVTQGGLGLTSIATNKIPFGLSTNTYGPLSLGTGLSISSSTLNVSLGSFTTTDLAEGSNLYYTDARARAALSGTTPITYNSSTGAIGVPYASSITDGVITAANFNTFNGKQDALTLPLPIANGGTGQITRAAALKALLPDTTGQTLNVLGVEAGGGIGWIAGGGGGGSGTVTSVALTVPSILSVSGSPVTSSGTLAVTLATETANKIFAGPTSGGAAIPTFRDMVTADIPNATVTNAKLANSSLTVTAGTGMSGGGSVALGSSVTLTNAGVTSAIAGTGISVDAATGAVTITNAGVTSLTGTANQITVSGATGSVTISTPQDIASGSSPTFTNLTLSGASGLQLTNATQPTISLTNTKGVTFTDGTNTLATIIDSGTVGSVKASGFIGGYFSGNYVGNWYGNVIPITEGGTGQVTANAALNALLPSQGSNSGKFLTTNGTDASWATISATGTVTSVALSVPSFLSVSGSPITSSGTLAVTLSGTALPIANGGTGQTTATTAFNALSPMTTLGDIIYGGASGTRTRLGIGSTGQVLTVDGTGVPVWTNLSGVSVTSFNTRSGSVVPLAGDYPETLGGTGQTTYALGDLLYSSATDVLSRLTGNTAATKKFLSQTGTGTVSAAPAWGILVSGDIPNNAANTSGTAAGLSSTLVVASGGTGQTTLTNHGVLVGAATTAITQLSVGASNTVLHGNTGADPSFSAVSLTADISGTLAETHGGVNQTSYATGDQLYASATNVLSKLTIGTINQVLQSNGSIPTWTSNLTLANGGSRAISIADASSAAGSSLTIHGGNANGSDLAAGNLVLASGNSTGTGLGGQVQMQASENTSSGSTAGTLKTILLASVTSAGAEFDFGVAGSRAASLVLYNGSTSNSAILKSASIATTNRTYTIPDVSADASFVMTQGAQTIAGTKTFSTAIAVGSGGTGSSSLTANNVLLGNGTSALQVVAPGTSGNVLTSNGTTWTSAAAAGGTVTTDGTTITGDGSGGAPITLNLGATNTWLAHQNISITGISTSLNVEGFNIDNPTVTDAGNTVENSAGLGFTAHGWSTTGTDADSILRARIVLQALTGATATSNLLFRFGNDDQGYATKMTLSSAGLLTLATPLAATSGGTGQSTWTTGQIPYASATNTIAKLNVGSTNQVLTVAAGIPSWATPTVGGQAIFGDGADATVYFDGTTTPVAGATLSGSTYTMTRVIRATNVTVASGVTVKPSNYPIFATGTLLDSGTIQANGNDAVTTTAGTALTGSIYNTNLGGGGGSGGAGANGRTTAGTGASSSTTNSVYFGGIGGAGASDGQGHSGGTSASAANSSRINPFYAFGHQFGSSSFGDAVAGGVGGAAGGFNTGTGSGAGGGAGAVVVIAAHVITVVSGATVSANGGNASAATGSGDAGGGGGGGGGAIILFSDTYSNAGTVTATHGNGAAGIGTGSTGSNGSDGTIYAVSNGGSIATTNGTVTSVAVSGGSTGLTTSGGPVTGSGTITLAGTLGTGYGGTNLTTYTAGDLPYASASNTLAKLPISTTGKVLTVSGGIPAWSSSVTLDVSPGNPTGTSNSSYKMMGLAGGSITPGGTGVTMIMVTGDLNSGATGNPTVQMRHGTGSAPANGAAATGTAIGSELQEVGIAGGSVPFSAVAIVSLTAGTAYWIDCALKSDGTSTATITNVHISAYEIK